MLILLSRLKKLQFLRSVVFFAFMLRPINIFHSGFVFFLACFQAVENSLVRIFSHFIAVETGGALKILRGELYRIVLG